MNKKEKKQKMDQGEKREQRKQYLFVIRELTSREIKRKYARSYLGIVWSVLNPLLSMTVLSLIFSQMFRRSIENYPIYYLTGNLVWIFFSGATNAAMTTLIDNKAMFDKSETAIGDFCVGAGIYGSGKFGIFYGSLCRDADRISYYAVLDNAVLSGCCIFSCLIFVGDFVCFGDGICIFWRYKTFVFCITDLMALLFGNFLSGRFLERICKRNGSGESDL